MIREIKYVCSATVDYFTCHAIFSRITDGALSKLSLNAYSKQPEYRVYFQDRVVTVIVNDEDLTLVNELPTSIALNHQGKPLTAMLMHSGEFEKKSAFNVGDFVSMSGVISYAKTNNSEGSSRHRSPINFKGEIVKEQRASTLAYLENKLGVDLKTEAAERSLRFEMITYKHFEGRSAVYSKTNQNKMSLHNVFTFEIQAFITNAEVVNSLEYTSIGKKRSYGFGNVNVR